MTLVTVIISTFNSAPFITETLESVYKQTWKEIELVITDDCSNDNTAELCSNWLKKKGKRFVHPKLITSNENTGISANANRGLKHSKGEWIKFLGADDSLKNTCIEDNIQWINNYPDIKILFSKLEIYKDSFKPVNLVSIIPDIVDNNKSIIGANRTAESQYRSLLLEDRINFSPSVFLHRMILLSIGGFDERFKNLEDYPLWLNLTKNGHKLYFMDKVTVNYRRHIKAINNKGIPFLINPNYYLAEPFRKVYTYPFLPPLIRADQKFRWRMSQIFRIDKLNRQGRFNILLLKILTVYVNPFRYVIKLKRVMSMNPDDLEFYS